MTTFDVALRYYNPEWGFSLRSCWLGQFVQSCEFLSRQWNCIFFLLDVAIFFFPSNFARRAYILLCIFITLKNYDPSSRVEPRSSRSVVWSSSIALAGPGLSIFICFIHFNWSSLNLLNNFFVNKFRHFKNIFYILKVFVQHFHFFYFELVTSLYWIQWWLPAYYFL
jgi:hypothetical protein